MGGKKKKGGGKKGKGKKGQEEEDLTTEKLQWNYQKKCKEQGVKMSRQMVGYFDDYYDEDEPIKKVRFFPYSVRSSTSTRTSAPRAVRLSWKP